MSCAGSGCLGDPARHVNESEDCLFLNIYKPPTVTTPLPVMVFIHGGSYTDGCSNNFTMEHLVAASIKAGRPVIGVTLNYRLNFFGFIGSDELRASAAESTGNYGIQDQRKAFEFVNKHIHLFGGNPQQVTLFGESAGAGSITSHLVMHLSYDKEYTNGKLFQRAICESGFGAVWASKPWEDTEKTFAKVKSELSCSNVSCLLGKTTADFYAVASKFPSTSLTDPYLPFAPAIDGVEITASPRKLLEWGFHAKDIPVLAGTNRDEFSLFLLVADIYPVNATELEYEAALAPYMPKGEVEEYLGYVKNNYSSMYYEYPRDLRERSFWWWAGMRGISDHEFTCPNRRAVTYYARGSETYSYFFTHASTSNTFIPGSGPDAYLVPHASELPYVFNCTRYNGGCDFTNATETALAGKIMNYWTEFATTGRLSGSQWQTHSGSFGNDVMLDIDVSEKVLTNFRSAQCDLWSTIMDKNPREGDYEVSKRAYLANKKN